MIIECVEVGELQVNCYILAESENSKAIIIDPGADVKKIINCLKKHSLQAALIINTHGHADHIGCDDKFGVPIYIHKLDASMLRDAELNFSNFLMSPYSVSKKAEIIQIGDKNVIELGRIKLEVIHTPGHTPGGISLYLNSDGKNVLFSGDALFYRSIGRTDFPGADGALLLKSIKEKLLILPPETVVYPGHGESSTINFEIKNNPFLD